MAQPARTRTVNGQSVVFMVRHGKVYLLFRAEDTVGRFGGTSRLGLAVSEDGRRFSALPEPVRFPDLDDSLVFEKEGGGEEGQPSRHNALLAKDNPVRT